MMKRQGDLLILKVKSIPADAVKSDNRILAEGEVTGHRHELDSGEVYEKNGVLYFRVGVVRVSNSSLSASWFLIGTWGPDAGRTNCTNARLE